MKVYKVLDDLSSEKSSENYPTVPVCDECEDELKGTEVLVNFVSDYNKVYGDSCHFCKKTVEQEKEENS